MNTIAIVCIFNYKTLPFTNVDLNRILYWINKRKWDIHIIGDQRNFEDPPNLWEAFRDSHVPSYYGDLKFPPINLVTSERELLNSLQSIKKYNRLFFYYSGHGVSKGLKLPNGDICRYDLLRDELLKISRLEIFGLFDCCHGPTFNLSWKWEDSVSKYSHTGYYHDTRITILSSSLNHQESGGSIYSSLLTRVFTDITDEIFMLKDLMTKYQEFVDMSIRKGTKNIVQTVSLFSNHSRYKRLPMFLFEIEMSAIYDR